MRTRTCSDPHLLFSRGYPAAKSWQPGGQVANFRSIRRYLRRPSARAAPAARVTASQGSAGSAAA
ncbi:MAG TPA: hypothetical protein PK170_10415, partial [Anaerolineae bacterium]|nr:hypothetical protein [Anaerolineae bacterium]